MNADHLVFDWKLLFYECKRCGAQQPIMLPSTIGEMIALGEQFTAEHEKCEATHAH